MRAEKAYEDGFQDFVRRGSPENRQRLREPEQEPFSDEGPEIDATEKRY
jgi:hypothetical protein